MQCGTSPTELSVNTHIKLEILNGKVIWKQKTHTTGEYQEQPDVIPGMQ